MADGDAWENNKACIIANTRHYLLLCEEGALRVVSQWRGNSVSHCCRSGSASFVNYLHVERGKLAKDNGNNENQAHLLANSLKRPQN